MRDRQTAQELCSLAWNAPAGENAWESPDGTTLIWRCGDTTWWIRTENALVGQRLARLSNVLVITQWIVGGYCEGFLVPWQKFKTCSLANALSPACDTPGDIPADSGANEALKVGLYDRVSEIGEAESESGPAGSRGR